MRLGTGKPALGLAFALAVAWGFLQHLPQLGEISFPLILLAITSFLFWILDDPGLNHRSTTAWTLAGIIAAAAIGVFFRLHHLWAVPPGYNFEPLNFLSFANRLVEEGFPYIPYSWYAHTFYSYLIAGFMLVVDDPLSAFRVASVAISLLTLLALYGCGASLFDRRTACMALALLGASYWHLFTARNGYHQQLLPLFQLLFLLGFIDGVRTLRWRGFLIAAFSMVLGLHAYWGFYLMPLFWAQMMIYLFLFQRDVLKRSVGPMSVATGITVVGIIPLGLFLVERTNVFQHVLSAFSPSVSATPDLLAKILKNVGFVLWSLSGHPEANRFAEYAPTIDPLTAALALLGLCISLRWFTKSIPHAAIVLLLATNVAGLAVTIGNYFYIVATLAPVFLLAAVGLGSIVQEWSKLGRYATVVVFLVLLGSIGWMVHRNHQEFFGKRIFRELAVPQNPPGSGYLLLEKLSELVDKRAVFLSRHEPGRDFDDQLYELAKRIPNYGFVAESRPFNSPVILFPADQLESADGVEVFVPNVPVVGSEILPRFRRLYPNLTISSILAPGPYRQRYSEPIAIQISIPRGDVVRFHGLAKSAPGTGTGSAYSGFLFASQSGRYRFTAPPEGVLEIWIHGRPLLSQDDGFLLEAGLHPIRVLAEEGSGMATLTWQFGDRPWQPLSGFLLNPGGLDEGVFSSHLASLGKVSDFYYSQRPSVPISSTLLDVAIAEEGSFFTVDREQLLAVSAEGVRGSGVSLPGPRDFRIERSGDTLTVVDPAGSFWHAVGSSLQEAPSIRCQVADQTVEKDRVIVLCRDSRLLASSGEDPAPQGLTGADGKPLLWPTRLVGSRRGYHIIDAGAGQLLRYSEDGRLLGNRHLKNLYWDSDLAVDPDGNLYVRRWPGEIRTYSPEGELLFHPVTGSPSLLVSGDRGAATIPFRLTFSGAFGAGVLDNQVILFERRRPTTKTHE